jgi:hypothetical protein
MAVYIFAQVSRETVDKLENKLIYPAGWLANPFIFMISSHTLIILLKKRKLSGVKVVGTKSQSKGIELQERTRVCKLIRADTWFRPYKLIVV